MIGKTRRYLLAMVGGLGLAGASVGAVVAAAAVPAAPALAGVESATVCTADGPVISCGEGTLGNPADGGVEVEAEGHYATPGGRELIDVRLRLDDEVVVGARIRLEAGSGTAQQFQEQFATRFAESVVGRPLAGLALSRVAGASLTTGGFNNALDQIRSDRASS